MPRWGRIGAALLLALIAGAIYAAVDRRWHREDAALGLVLNVPAYRLDVFEGDERIRSYEVAVGQRGHRTPAGSYAISRIVWNPWWHPPASKWARGRKPVPPGPSNPMGRVKLDFRDLYYVHGTPERQSLGQPASHGCVRMRNEDVIELARLVHGHATPDVSEQEIQLLLEQSRRTRAFRLARRVPFRVVYQVVEVRAGVLQIHPDVYRLAGRTLKERVIQLLLAEGYQPAELDESRLQEIVERGVTQPVSVPLDSLLAPSAAQGPWPES